MFIIPQPRLTPKLRLFCFPFAGGSAYNYLSWLKHFDPQVELVLVQLKGRADRIGETPAQSMQAVVDEILLSPDLFLTCRYMLFGHSLGALICYALSCELKKRQLPLPEHLFVSGSRAAHQPYLQQPLHALPQPQFFKALHQLNGTPAEVLANTELMALFEPLLRADFKIAETYQAELVQMPFAVSVFYGDKDPSLSMTQLEAWQELTSQSCTLTEISGDHFFVQHSADQLIAAIQQVLQPYIQANR